MNEIRTPRLRLVAVTVELLDTELRNDGSLFTALTVKPASEWPPLGGEHDRDAVLFFRSALLQDPQAAGWLTFYVCLDDELVGSAGYFGPPDRGTSEIGFSVSTTWRRHGIATEAVGGLIEHARSRDADRIIAHTAPDNLASIGVLTANRFVESTSEPHRPGHRLFERALP